MIDVSELQRLRSISIGTGWLRTKRRRQLNWMTVHRKIHFYSRLQISKALALG